MRRPLYIYHSIVRVKEGECYDIVSEAILYILLVWGDPRGPGTKNGERKHEAGVCL